MAPRTWARTIVLAGVLVGGLAAPAQAAVQGEAGLSRPVVVDVSPSGEVSNGSLTAPQWVTPDGRFVLFQSDAENLVGPTAPSGNGSGDAVYLYRRDLRAGRTVLATGLLNGRRCLAQSAGTRAVMTPDGRFIAYGSSLACDPRPGMPQKAYQIFVYDMQTGSTRAASVNSAGAYGRQASEVASISDDGQVVAFSSHADNLQTGGDQQGHVFVHDMATGQTHLVDAQPDGTASPVVAGEVGGSSALSPDGRRLVYTTYNGDTGRAATRLRNLATGTDTLINNAGVGAALSRDGRYITGYTHPGGGYVPTLFDLTTGRNYPMSPPQPGSSYTECDAGALSSSNRYLVYRCSMPATEAEPGHAGVFRRDRQAGTITRIDEAPNARSYNGSPLGITTDGTVLFVSANPAFVPAGAPPGTHVLLRR